MTEKHDCQCGGCYITNHKARHLKTTKHLQYYNENTYKITEKHDCQCGGCYITNHKARHLKTAKHLQWVNDQQI
jgi:hypothetical protein